MALKYPPKKETKTKLNRLIFCWMETFFSAFLALELIRKMGLNYVPYFMHRMTI